MKFKIIVPHLIVVLLLGVGLYVCLAAVSQWETQSSVKKQLKTVSGLFVRSEALHGHELISETSRLATSRIVADVFREMSLEKKADESPADFDGRLRREWFRKALSAVESVSVRLESSGKSPALVFVTDRNGVVLARNTTPNACPAGKNVADSMTVVRQALDGEAGFAYWSISESPFDGNSNNANHLCSLMNGGLLETAAAPIWGPHQQVAGALVVGYEVSNGMAAAKSKRIGVELAVLEKGKVYSTSLQTDSAREELNQQIGNSKQHSKLGGIAAGKRSNLFFTFSIKNRKYLGFFTPLSGPGSEKSLVYLFLASIDDNGVCRSGGKILAIAIFVAMLCVFGIGMFLSGHFMKPIIEIEEGVLKIINGATEHRFDVQSDEVGGLGYRINQMVNVLAGRDDSSDEDS